MSENDLRGSSLEPSEQRKLPPLSKLMESRSGKPLKALLPEIKGGAKKSCLPPITDKTNPKQEPPLLEPPMISLLDSSSSDEEDYQQNALSTQFNSIRSLISMDMKREINCLRPASRYEDKKKTKKAEKMEINAALSSENDNKIDEEEKCSSKRYLKQKVKEEKTDDEKSELWTNLYLDFGDLGYDPPEEEDLGCGLLEEDIALNSAADLDFESESLAIEAPTPPCYDEEDSSKQQNMPQEENNFEDLECQGNIEEADASVDMDELYSLDFDSPLPPCSDEELDEEDGSKQLSSQKMTQEENNFEDLECQDNIELDGSENPEDLYFLDFDSPLPPSSDGEQDEEDSSKQQEMAQEENNFEDLECQGNIEEADTSVDMDELYSLDFDSPLPPNYDEELDEEQMDRDDVKDDAIMEKEDDCPRSPWSSHFPELSEETTKEDILGDELELPSPTAKDNRKSNFLMNFHLDLEDIGCGSLEEDMALNSAADLDFESESLAIEAPTPCYDEEDSSKHQIMTQDDNNFEDLECQDNIEEADASVDLDELYSLDFDCPPPPSYDEELDEEDDSKQLSSQKMTQDENNFEYLECQDSIELDGSENPEELYSLDFDSPLNYDEELDEEEIDRDDENDDAIMEKEDDSPRSPLCQNNIEEDEDNRADTDIDLDSLHLDSPTPSNYDNDFDEEEMDEDKAEANENEDMTIENEHLSPRSPILSEKSEKSTSQILQSHLDKPSRQEDEIDRSLEEEGEERLSGLRQTLLAKRREEEARLREESEKELEEFRKNLKADQMRQKEMIRKEEEFLKAETNETLETLRQSLLAKRREEETRLKQESEKELEEFQESLQADRMRKEKMIKQEERLLKAKADERLETLHQSLLAKTKDEEEKLNEEFEKKIQLNQKRLQDKIKKENNAMLTDLKDKLQKQQEEDVKQLKAKNVQRLERLKAEFEEEMATEKDKLQKKKEEILNSVKTDIEEEKKALMKAKYAERVNQYRKQMADQFKAVRQGLKQEQEKELKLLKENHKKEMDEAKTQHLNEMHLLRSSHKNDKDQLQASHEQELSNQRKLEMENSKFSNELRLRFKKLKSQEAMLVAREESLIKRRKGLETGESETEKENTSLACVIRERDLLKEELARERKEKQDIAQVKEELRKSRQECDRTRDELRKSREECDRARDELRKSREESDRARDELRKSREECDRARDELRKSREECDRTRNELRKTREECDNARDALRKTRQECADARDGQRQSKEECNRAIDELTKMREESDRVKEQLRNSCEEKNATEAMMTQLLEQYNKLSDRVGKLKENASRSTTGLTDDSYVERQRPFATDRTTSSAAFTQFQENPSYRSTAAEYGQRFQENNIITNRRIDWSNRNSTEISISRPFNTRGPIQLGLDEHNNIRIYT